jgi:hypothetical protein
VKTIALSATALLFVFALVFAQEATDVDLHPRQQQQTLRQAIEPQPNVPDLSDLDQAFRQSSLGKEADERRLHLEWRQLANRVGDDPQVVAAKKSAESARTDLEKRERLRNYYEIYYGKMRALASSSEMKNALDALKQEHLIQINQPRVRHLTDEGLPTPTPTRTRRKP